MFLQIDIDILTYTISIYVVIYVDYWHPHIMLATGWSDSTHVPNEMFVRKDPLTNLLQVDSSVTILWTVYFQGVGLFFYYFYVL